jgi:hypothetical protein
LNLLGWTRQVAESGNFAGRNLGEPAFNLMLRLFISLWSDAPPHRAILRPNQK